MFSPDNGTAQPCNRDGSCEASCRSSDAADVLADAAGPSPAQQVYKEHMRQVRESLGEHGDFIDKMESVTDLIETFFKQGQAAWFVSIGFNFDDKNVPVLQIGQLKKRVIPSDQKDKITEMISPYKVEFSEMGHIKLL